MQLLIRADASSVIGSGHIMRCLVLAKMARAAGATVRFACADLPGNKIALLEECGYEVHMLADIQSPLPSDVHTDWLLVDHYQLGNPWEQAARKHTRHIVVIDDLGRAHDADLLQDATAIDDPARYTGKVPEGCICLLGPEYALINPAFTAVGAARKALPAPRLFLSYGGADPQDFTAKTFAALTNTPIAIETVIGGAHPNPSHIHTLAAQLPDCTVHHNVSTVPDIMARCDWALISGGVLLWEASAAGLSIMAAAIFDNQKAIVKALGQQGYLQDIGTYATFSKDHIQQQVQAIMQGAPPIAPIACATRAGEIWQQMVALIHAHK